MWAGCCSILPGLCQRSGIRRAAGREGRREGGQRLGAARLLGPLPAAWGAPERGPGGEKEKIQAKAGPGGRVRAGRALGSGDEGDRIPSGCNFCSMRAPCGAPPGWLAAPGGAVMKRRAACNSRGKKKRLRLRFSASGFLQQSDLLGRGGLGVAARQVRGCSTCLMLWHIAPWHVAPHPFTPLFLLLLTSNLSGSSGA